MLITIYDSAGNPKVELSPNDSSTQVKEVQGDSVLTLSFTHYEHIELDVDDYADFLGERFWLTEKYRPRQNSKKEWVYDLKLYGVESMLKRILVIKTVDGEDNPVFTLTAPPREHVAMIVNCMNHGMGNITDWKVGQVNGTENIVIDYFGKYCDEALKEIAEKVGAEWWAEDRTVNICKCEHGEPVELGYNKGLLSIDPGTADNVKFYTRLYPVGSSRNIDPEKYGHSRLQLPDGKKYVEINADKYARVDHYEESAFADIYPRRIGEISSVRSEVRTGDDGKPFTVYYFKDSALTFDPNEYMIGGLVLRVSFQEGSELAGLGDEEDGTYFFEVNFDSAGKEFEIITIWPYDNDTQLPGGNLVPKIGDKYILWHLRMPDEYYALAEEEFLEAVNKYNDDHKLDISVYKAPTDHVWIEDNNIELTIGRRVRLESEEYFPGSGYRESRITRITRRVNLPSYMDIEIGDTLSRTSQDKINDSISEVHSYAKSIAESVSLPDIIRTGDKTRPTDNNLYSAKRVLTEFLSKLKDDRSKGKIASDLGFEIGNYLAGVSGGIFGIDADNGDSFAEVARLFVRGKAYFETLTTMESKTLAGKQYTTPGGSIKCTKVEELKNPNGKVITYRCYFLSEQDGEKTETKIIAGDQAISEMFNAKTGVTNNKLSNHRYWRLVTSVNNDAYSDYADNHYGYIDLSAVDCESDSDIPKEGDVIEQFGNRTDATRQSAMVFSTVDADAPSIKMFAGIGSGTTNSEHYSLSNKAIISFGRDAATGKVYFRLGATDATQFLDYKQDEGLTLNGKLSVNTTIGDKTIDEYFADKAEAATDKYKYLAVALPQDTEITGGVMLSTLVSLGYTDSASVRHTLAGMNGGYVPTLGGRTIGSWWGGPMVDLFDVNDTKKNLAAGTYATSMVRMDGSVYFLGGDIQFRSDKTAVFGSGDTAITIADGRVKLGNGILIDIGGEAQGLGNSIASVATLANELSNLFTPYNGTTELTWQEVIDGETYDSIKANHSFWTEYSLAGKGLAPAGGSSGGGGGSLFGLYTDTTWVSTPAEDDALSAVLGKSLHARVSVLEGAGYLTGITKAMVEAVLTGDITTHTHSLLSKPADNRSVATAPNDYNSKFFFTGMKYRSTMGVQGTGDYVNGFGWRGWLDSSGGKAWEVFGDNADLYVRCGSTTTWEAWRKILTDGNYASVLDSRYIRPTGISAQFLMADGSVTTKVVASAVANTGWQNNAVDDLKVPTMSFLAYWNGAHTNGGSSNLQYCDRGRFGTMAVANAANYLARSGGSMTNTNLVSNLNANYLGGYTHEQIRRNALGFTPTVVPTSSGNCDLDLLKDGMARNYWAPEKWVHAPEDFGYGAAVVFAPFGYTNLHGQLAWDVNHAQDNVTRNLYWRVFATATGGTDKWGGWRQIAFTDGTIANATNAVNADIANKLRINNSTQENCLQYMQNNTGWNAWDAPSQTYYHVIKMNHGNGDTYYNRTLAFSFFDDRIYAGRLHSGSFKGWKTLAFLDDNVASATKLQTARSIWGQNFDGTSAITGNMIHVGEFRFEAGTAVLHNATTKVYQLWAVNGINLFPTWSVNTAVLSVTPNGNVGRVGVNMFSPAYDFDVTGVIHASGEIFSDKAIGGKGMTSSSDIRQKHIVGDFAMSLEDILKIPLKRFKWLDGPDKDERIGVIAQEALKIVPQVVYLKPDGFYGVDYGALAHAEAKTAVRELVEQRTIIAKQGRQIKKLEKLVQKLQQKIHA